MKTLQPLPPGEPWPRPYLNEILQMALNVKTFSFARQAALAWLTHYERDLHIQFLHAQAFIGEGMAAKALPILEGVCTADPEFFEAQELRASVGSNLQAKGMDAARGAYLALGGRVAATSKLAQPAPAWTQPLRVAYHALQGKNFAAAEEIITETLIYDPPNILAALTHLRILWSQPETPQQATQSLAEHYHRLWPDCVTIQLILADSMMSAGSADHAVALLHRAASSDPAGQVPARLWGVENPYRTLWPERMRAVLDISIPAGVAAALGWNLLPNGQPRKETEPASNIERQPEKSAPTPGQASALPHSPEILPIKNTPKPPSRSGKSSDLKAEVKRARAEARHILNPDKDKAIQKEIGIELETAARRLKLPDLPKTDGALPVYVVMSTQNGMVRKYGAQTAGMIDEAMQALTLRLRQRNGWGALLVYPDDPAGMAGLGLKPAAPDDPWALKLALHDIDTALRAKGTMIGALLIVGGPEIVPFHHLPNPTDDADADVPSDNPYATRDENYFIPEWPIGRLPGGAGRDPALLLSAMRGIAAQHKPKRKKSDGPLRWMIEFLRRVLPQRAHTQSFGYSAEIWQKAAASVFTVIGEPRQMLTSPPVGSENKIPAPTAQLGYFNLHGLEDAAEWYGQRAPNSNGDGSPTNLEFDFPVALRPRDVVNGGRAPQVIFSEACYGAHLFNRGVEESLALKFLNAGARAVVGSTAVAYGSVTTPLNAADLLGKAFWEALQSGYPAGEALRRAKIHLASEMHNRQGYLDGEDQKTLISFVLYGDPLAYAQDNSGFKNRKSRKDITRYTTPPLNVKTICDRADNPGSSEPIPAEVMKHVKQVVKLYLPGMKGAHLALSHEHAGCCCEGHTCPSGQLGEKSRPNAEPQRSVVVLSKEIRHANRLHPAYARLTMDAQGKVVKLAVSR